MLALVDLCGLGERYPHELSGGQQQRVALARALAPGPELVLLDEPWSNIDPHLRASMRDELARILRAIDVTVVLVTHDREEAFSLADRIALMRNGTRRPGGHARGALPLARDALGRRVRRRRQLPPRHARERRRRDARRPLPRRNASADSAVEVLIRPELLELEPDPAGDGEVVGREFRGHDVFYRVLLDGVELVSQRPSNEDVPLGSRVHVRPHASRVTVFS